MQLEKISQSTEWTLKMRINIFVVSILTSGLCFSGHSDAGETSVNEIIRALAPGVQAAYEKLNRSIDLEIQFETNSAKLTKTAEKQLEILAKAFLSEDLSQSKFIIAGHTDASGAATYNKSLSRKRAEAVVVYLEEKFQINRTRFVVKGYGEERLRDEIDPKASINRRVEVTRIDKNNTDLKPKDNQIDFSAGKASSNDNVIKW